MPCTIERLFQFICPKAFTHDREVERLHNESDKLVQSYGNGRNESYFHRIKKFFDVYRVIYHRPSLSELGFLPAIIDDIEKLQDLYLYKSESEPKEMLKKACIAAKNAGFPVSVLEEAVGDSIDLEELDEKSKELKYSSYIELINKECMICSENYVPSDFIFRRITRGPNRCGHFSHEECMKLWLKTTGQEFHCPMCRHRYELKPAISRWNVYLTSIEDKVENDTRINSAKEPAPDCSNDASLALQSYEADLRWEQVHEGLERDDERFARDIEADIGP